MAPHAEESVSGATYKIPQAHEDVVRFSVDSPNVRYTEDEILSKYSYHTALVEESNDGRYIVRPKETIYDFKVQRKVGRVGLMLVGWGGNNGSTVTAGILANRDRLGWETREGTRSANYYGSIMMSSTVKLGTNAENGKDVHIPFRDMLPMLHPDDLVIGGWDISSMNLADAMDRAQVLEPSLKNLVRKRMALMAPLPSIYYPDFIAANQEKRADNLLTGSKASVTHVNHIRKDIR